MTIDHRKLPRRPRPISPRDQAIYIAYRSQGLTQAQLAKQFRLGQRRISTIIQRVEQAQSSTDAAAPISPLEIARASAQAIYTRALRFYDHAPAEITTTQTGHRGQSPFKVTTRRQLPPDHHFLKAALNASANLTLLATRPPRAPSAATHSAASNYSNRSNPASPPSPQPLSPQSLPSEIQDEQISDQPVNFQDALNLLLSYMTPQPPITP